jgi:lipid-A-disaccharide synthase
MAADDVHVGSNAGRSPGRKSVLVVAGETSGEQHAAGLVAGVAQRAPDADIDWFGTGSEAMRQAGVDLLADVSGMAAIGPWDAAAHLIDYWRLFRRCLREAETRKPDLAVLVDFPEFNLRLARRLHRMGVTVCYFIGPQLWAWRSSRIRLIRRYIELMLVILPFEEGYYRQRGVEARFVGNPSIRLRSSSPSLASRRPGLVALMPGSRTKEVERILPVQLDAARFIADRYPGAVFWIVKAPGVPRELYDRCYRDWLSSGQSPLCQEVRAEPAWNLLPGVDCAIIKSGTSTLEAMAMGVPFAMVYRVPAVTWYLARPLVGTDTYCLANLVAGRKIVPEFVQHEARGSAIGSYILSLLENEVARERVRLDLLAAAEGLTGRDAYLEAADSVLSLLFKDEPEQ